MCVGFCWLETFYASIQTPFPVMLTILLVGLVYMLMVSNTHISDPTFAITTLVCLCDLIGVCVVCYAYLHFLLVVFENCTCQVGTTVSTSCDHNYIRVFVV